MSKISKVGGSFYIDEESGELMLTFRVQFANSVKPITIKKQYFLTKEEISSFKIDPKKFKNLGLQHLERIVNLKKDDIYVVWEED